MIIGLKMIKNKGSIEIIILTLTIIIMLIMLVIIFLLQIQINSCIYSVKSDLFYIAQNAYIAADHSELVYSNYVIDDKILKEKIAQILKLNYPKYEFIINEIKYQYTDKSIVIDINLLINPIILSRVIGNININIKDNVKLKLMEVK